MGTARGHHTPYERPCGDCSGSIERNKKVSKSFKITSNANHNASNYVSLKLMLTDVSDLLLLACKTIYFFVK